MLIPRLKDRFSKTKTPKTPGTPGTPSDPSNPDDGKVKSSKVNVRKVPERAL